MLFEILFVLVLIPAVGFILSKANDQLETKKSPKTEYPQLRLVVPNSPRALRKR
ncbi:hypothetical protein H0266_15825 [Halobacillus locisalis]|uniref:Uncharacterized protein n=1 Tax=Halobacillus locisalis TaxID=220753 RepID=A0A838CXP1_9BACI|nr:hypothetical protein [Halobacillus locisalis]MBA2176366.1 hypothetical protein [Halobacillus locisalis]